jgi:hypothetical protein
MKVGMKLKSERWVFTNDKKLQFFDIWNDIVDLVDQKLKPTGIGVVRNGSIPICWGGDRGFVWVTASELRVFVALFEERENSSRDPLIAEFKASVRDLLESTHVLSDDDCWNF